MAGCGRKQFILSGNSSGWPSIFACHLQFCIHCFSFCLRTGHTHFRRGGCFTSGLSKWPYATRLKEGDQTRNGCYLISRSSPKTTYALKDDDYMNLHTIDVKEPDLYCTERDMLIGDFYIINKLEYGEALEAYLKPENTEELLVMRVLLYPSDEINKNFMRLFSIIPLVFQANRLKTWSIAFSIIIVVIDIFSNILEKKLWAPMKLKLKDVIKSQLAKVKNRSFRSSTSKYLSSVSLSLLHSDNFTCNFKRVDPEENVFIMPNTYLKGYKLQGFDDYNYDPIEKYRIPNEEVKALLEEEDDSFIEKHNKGQKLERREGYFSIPRGSMKYTINTKQGKLKCIFVPGGEGQGMAYNFLDDAELHWGPYEIECTDLIISFLRLITELDYLPFKMSIKRTYHTEGYDRVFTHVAFGGWFLKARAIHKGFVS